MKDDNAKIIIDVVMGELEKKNEFTTKLSKVAENAISQGFKNASKARKSALSSAIVNGVYTETPASKRAIKKLARDAMGIVNQEVDKFNKKYGRQGGFWNTIGSLAVNTGILRFGQGYKGGNFLRDRYVDTYKTMSKTGQITEYSKVNYGRVGGDVISAGQFLANSIMTIAEIISKGAERITKNMEEGIDNSKEIAAIAKTLGLSSNSDVRSIAAGVNVIDALAYGTGQKNVANTLTQFFADKEQQNLARKAGMRGKTPFDLALEYVQMIATGKKYDDKGNLVDLTDEERTYFNKLSPVMATKEFRRKLQENASAYEGLLFTPGGVGPSLYTEAYKTLGDKPLTIQELENYLKQTIMLNLSKLSEQSKAFMGPGAEEVYNKYYNIQKQEVERELAFFKNNAADILESQGRIEKFLGAISDNVQIMVSRLINPKMNSDTADAVIDATKIVLLSIIGGIVGNLPGAIAAGSLGATLNTYNKRQGD